MQRINLETIQWTLLRDIDDVEPVTSKDYQVLAELRSVIAKHNYFDRLGICLLHKHFDLKEGEILMERTDTETRVSTVSVELADEAEPNTIETMWKFTDGVNAVIKCVQRCNYLKGHKRRHGQQV